MKRLWIALALLAAIFSGTLVHSRCLTQLTEQLTTRLDQARQLADAGDWTGATRLVEQAEQCWKSRDFYLYTMLRHGCLDDIRREFAQAREYLDHRAAWELGASLSNLSAQLSLLSEAEQLTAQNIL